MELTVTGLLLSSEDPRGAEAPPAGPATRQGAAPQTATGAAGGNPATRLDVEGKFEQTLTVILVNWTSSCSSYDVSREIYFITLGSHISAGQPLVLQN